MTRKGIPLKSKSGFDFFALKLNKRFNIIKDFTMMGWKNESIEVWGFDSYSELKETLKEHRRDSAPFDFEYLDTQKTIKEDWGFAKYSNGKIIGNCSITEITIDKKTASYEGGLYD